MLYTKLKSDSIFCAIQILFLTDSRHVRKDTMHTQNIRNFQKLRNAPIAGLANLMLSHDIKLQNK